MEIVKRLDVESGELPLVSIEADEVWVLMEDKDSIASVNSTSGKYFVPMVEIASNPVSGKQDHTALVNSIQPAIDEMRQEKREKYQWLYDVGATHVLEVVRDELSTIPYDNEEEIGLSMFEHFGLIGWRGDVNCLKGI